MIYRKIRVVYYHNNKTNEWCKDAPAKYGNEYYDDRSISNYWNYSDYEKDTNDPTKSPNRKRFWSIDKHIFNRFTNKGKLSKTELKNLSKAEKIIFQKDAEKQLAFMLELEKSTKIDTEKALKLVQIINSANWNNLDDKDLAVIKVKNSHSKRYQKHSSEPSTYLTLVPVSVAKEAIELQQIRRKHQNDSTFDFFKTSCNVKIVRVADHPNHEIDADIDPVNADWTKMFNCSFID